MASRVEKYYDKNIDASKRSVKNRDLYKTIYEDETYTNIEAVVENPKANEVDMKKIQELLLKQEKEYKTRNQLVKRDLEIPDMESLDAEEEKNYDIRDVLAQAKEDQEDLEETRPRSLKDIDFEAIRNRLNETEKIPDEKAEKDLKELKELISTIAGTNTDLNKLADKELSLDMFAELAASTKELSNDDSDAIKKIIAEAKKIEEKKQQEEEPFDVDKSFYTSTLNLKKKDFEDEDDKDEKTGTGSRVVIIVLLIIVAIVAVVVAFNILR